MAEKLDSTTNTKDKHSDAVAKMRNTQMAFRNELSQLMQEMDRLSNNKITIKTNFSDAGTEIKNAKKDFAALSNEMSRLKNLPAQINYDNIKRNLHSVSSGARQTEKDMKILSTQISKTDNRAGTMQMGKLSGKMMMDLGKAGLFDLAGQSLLNAGQTYISSAFGSSAGNAVGSVVSSSMSGAAIGTMIAPGIGTVIGGAVGTVAGTINAAAEKYKNEDAAFKAAVKTEYDRVKGIERTDLETGTGIAANRETMRLSLATQLGSPGAADALLGQAQSYATKTSYGYEAVAGAAQQLATYGTPLEEVMSRVGQLGDMAQGQADVLDSIASAYSKMTATQVVSMEELNTMTEAGIPILKQLSRQYGVTEEQMLDMVSQGKLGVGGVNQAMDALTGTGGPFNNMTDKVSQTYSGLQATRDGLEADLQAAMGEGYNSKRMEGLQSEIDFMNSEAGQKMKDGYRKMGEWRASLENEQGEILQRYMTDLLKKNDDYTNAVNSGNDAEVGRLMALTRAQAEMEYRRGPGFRLQQQSDLQLVVDLRDSMGYSWYSYGFAMQTEFEKGRAAVPANPNDPFSSYQYYEPFQAGSVYGPSGKPITVPHPSDVEKPKITSQGDWLKFEDFKVPGIGHNAYGLPYVPYDNYAALLHQGERVLTAREARNYQDGGGVSINIGGMTVREEADIDRIAKTIVREIQYAKVGYGG